ncbi:MAG: GldG family protein [Spirochaetales bacterium]|nr:GldG family protein [Spirochaetales bacterium]
MNDINIQNKRIQSWIILVLVILNIIAFIFISNKAYIRFDMTEGKKYSISAATKNLLKKLDNTLVIEYYYNDKSKEISGVAQVIQYITDMLREYENAGKGYVNVVIRELSFQKPADQALISELEVKGIKQYQLSQQEQAEAKSLLGFSGMIIKYKDNETVIPAIFQDMGFEFRIDSEIAKMMGGEEKVGVIFSSSVGTLENEFKYIRQVVEREFSDVRVLPKDHNIPPELTVLLVVGGKGLSQYDMLQIDQFLMNGGKVFFAVNGVDVNISQYGMYATPGDTDLIDLLQHYGIKLNRNLVGDNQSYNGVRQGFSMLRYPLWVKVKSSNINRDSAVVSGIDRLNLLWTSSIDIMDSAKDKAHFLFKTTNDAWSQDQNYQVDLDAYKYPVQQGGNTYTLAVAFDGEVSSYFADKDIPVNEVNEKEQFTANRTAKGNAKFILVGCEQFLHSNFAGNDEFIFLMNGLDWLSKDGSLIEIRNKGKFTQPLDKIKDMRTYGAVKSFIIGFSTFGVAVLFIILGVVLFIMRQIRSKKVYEHYKKD